MKAQEIISQIKGKAGQHVKAIWQRLAKTRKDCDCIIAKRTAAYIRTGIDYAIRAANAAKETGPLPWGEWMPGFEHRIITHKGAEYVRMYPATFANLMPKVEWTLNGIPATYADVEPFLLASEKHKENDERPLCFTIKADSLIEIAE